MRRWILFAVASTLLALLALPAVALYYLAFTESGLRFIVDHIPQRIGRAELHIEKVSGTIARGLHVGRIEVRHERVHVLLSDIDSRIDLAPLILQTLRSPEVRVGNALIEVHRRTRPVRKYEPRFLPRAIKIVAERVRVDAGTLIVPNGRRFDTTRIRASGVVGRKLIRLFDLGFAMDAWEITGDGELRAADPLELEGAARLTWKSAGQPPWIIAASGEGDLHELALRARFTSPMRADFVGSVQDLTRGWHWQGKARIHELDVQDWGASAALGRITGELDLGGDAGGFSARGPLTPAGLGAGSFRTSFQGSYAQRVIKAASIEVTHASSGAHATGRGEIAIVAGGPRLDLEGSWRDFRWPLVGERVVFSESGRYALRGTRPYDVRASGSVTVRDWEPLPVEVDGRLDRGTFLIGKAVVKALDGQTDLSGEVSWSPRKTWLAAGRAEGIDPGRIRKDLPGKLSIAFEAAGEGFSADDGLAIRIRNVSGQMRNVPARGSGRLVRQGTTWQFENVRGRLGGTVFALDGELNDQFDLRFALEAEDLSLLAPESRGWLHAQGIVRGTGDNPLISVTASGRSITHRGITLASFDSRIDFDPHSSRQSRIDVRAHDLAYGERKLEELAFSLDGTAAQHILRLDLEAPGLKWHSRAEGAFADGVWRGQLRRLDVNGSESLHLELEAPSALLASARTARVEQLCLNGSPGRLCTRGEWSPQQWSAAFAASELPMSAFTAGLTPGVEYRGMFNVSAEASGAAGRLQDGFLRADLVDAQLAHRLASGRIETITLGSGVLSATAKTDSVDGEITLEAGDTGSLDGQFSIRRPGERWQNMPLKAVLRARTAEFGFVSIYVPQIDRAKGTLAVDLIVGGTVGAPLVNGIVKLSEAELDLYQINLALRGVGLQARLLDNGLDFGGSANIGSGTARARGRLEWREGRPYGRLSLDGERLRIVNVPEAQIDASPDLQFHIEGRKIEVTGKVTVPEARIVPADLTDAVRASSDEVIVDDRTDQASERFEVVSNINLALGDRVSIDTSGLRGRLTGNIAVRSGYDEITRAAGELNVEDGEYIAYGRRLDIRRGRLIFTGGPIGNPGVDIRAVKQYPDVVAGVNVRGTLLQPRMTFFSEPPLPQSQIVSLILAGGSLASTQNGGNGGAGNELLAQGGAILAQQLGARVGIEDVSIESNLDNETSLVLGKYLSPRLYVSYGISLTESLNTLKLRYTLSDKWTIRTELSEEGGADLVYTIDK